MHYKKKVLPNGLRIIAVPMKDNPTATVMVLVEAGSKYETKEISGLSHFLEHMCFKGTTKRPRGIDIAQELDAIGAEYNAFTGHEYTGYHAKAEAGHVDTLLDVISDIYLNSTFPEMEIEKEKGVIIEEMNMYEDMPNHDIYDVFLSVFYGDQPVGWKIVGTPETVRNMKQSDFLKYRKLHYVAGSTTVVIAGGIDARDIFKKVSKRFKEISPALKKNKKKTHEPKNLPLVHLKQKKTDQAHMMLGFRSFNTYHKDSMILSVISVLLQGGMSSRLWQKLREDLGVCYYVNASQDAYTDHGVFSVSAGLDINRVPEVITAILEEFRRLKTEPVSSYELDRVKQYMIGRMKLGYESSDTIAYFWGMQEILRKELLGIEERADMISEVTSEDILRVSKRIFTEESLALAIIGPFKNEEKFKKLLKV